MKLLDLEPRFLARDDDRHFRDTRSLAKADGVIFLCPLCFTKNGGSKGTHAVICWRPRVPQTTSPTPGRWEFEGTGLDDLTLVAGSSSVLLTGKGCKAHFFVRGGEIIMT